jgi:hypothetical protein
LEWKHIISDIFLASFKPKKVIDNPSEEELRARSLEQGDIITQFGNLPEVTLEQ